MKNIATAVFGVVVLLLLPRPAAAQLGAMVSPGRLTKAHASLEGVGKCQSCHEAGRRVTVEKCLSCHKPIADRVRAKKGVHRAVAGDCVACHVEHAGVDAELRPFDAASFDHAGETGFPLDGRHSGLQCATCHKTRSFLAVKPECAGCHRDAHKGQLGVDCARCHATAVAFKETRSRFDHSRTGFPLVGAHRKADCALCHPNGRYRVQATAQSAATGPKGASATCATCHKSPHKAPLGPACATCHSSESWKTQVIDHARTGFPLKGLHARVACASCHRQPAAGASLPAQRCADCHSDPHRGSFKQDCASCHNERGFGGAPFDHGSKTAFPLIGAHAKARCVDCHKREGPATPAARRTNERGGAATNRNVAFTKVPSDCASCHRDVHRGDAGTTCQACHSATTFQDVRYVHRAHPEFFADGHAKLPCAKCHAGRAPAPSAAFDLLVPALSRMPRLLLTSSGRLQLAMPATQSSRGATRRQDLSTWRFAGVTTECASCHKDPHLGQFGGTCERCHAVSGAKFAAVKFSHAAGSFSLTGRHGTVECAKCHRRESASFPSGRGSAVRYKGVSGECRTCHQDTHLGQLGARCEICHTATAFTVSAYRHVLKPEMGKGRHAVLECRACHKREEGMFPAGRGTATRYLGFSSGCASCHADAHKGTLGTTCETCHGVETFTAVSRAFHKTGAFPLEGRHLDVKCASCHVNGQVKSTPTKCYDCHWIRRQDDRYQLRLGADCETCHRPISWTATRWSHVAATGVALNPTHRILGCDSCHRSLEFRKGLGVDCATCHATKYQQTTQPNHVAAGFPLACDACHKPSDPDWHRARFDHSAFPLVGQHAQTTCSTCHRGGVYQGTPRECLSCHNDDYRAAKQPDHVAAGFSTSCEQCHRASDPDWHRATFDHDQYFRLDGRHRTLQCVACHVQGRYAGTPRECVICHRADYDRTQTPNHAAAGFPTNCEQCHRPSDPSWRSGSFSHDAYFRLEGTHRAAQCAACHQNNRYAGTPKDCVACHRANYEQTRSPNHAAAGFPMSCESCHRASDATWNQGRFNHPFPISGPHRVACSQCHLAPSNYKSFSCTVCHERGKTDSGHKGEAGYRYDSLACYACHPNGKH